jgi:hypothetical protein
VDDGNVPFHQCSFQIVRYLKMIYVTDRQLWATLVREWVHEWQNDGCEKKGGKVGATKMALTDAELVTQMMDRVIQVSYACVPHNEQEVEMIKSGWRMFDRAHEQAYE